MPKLWRSILARRVITDSETNTASYIDSVESFAVPSLPHSFPPIVISAVWSRDRPNEKLLARVRIKAPDGEFVFVFDYPELVLKTDLHRYNLQIGGFKIASAGTHEATIELRAGNRWKTVATLPFSVQLLPQEADTPSKASGARRKSSRKAPSGAA